MVEVFVGSSDGRQARGRGKLLIDVDLLSDFADHGEVVNDGFAVGYKEHAKKLAGA